MSEPQLTSPSGDTIEEGDPRIPRRSAVEKTTAAADLLAQQARAMSGRTFDAKVDADARLDAMISLFVPPEGPVRNLFDFRTQENRQKAYREIIEAIQRVKAEEAAPSLLVPVTAVPQDLLRPS